MVLESQEAHLRRQEGARESGRKGEGATVNEKATKADLLEQRKEQGRANEPREVKQSATPVATFPQPRVEGGGRGGVVPW